VTAAIIIAEIGVDLSSFPTVGQFAAWIGVCPGNNESAGKSKAIGARRGNPYLTAALCNAATSAARRRGSFFKAAYHRLKSRRGGGRAALAIAHKLATAVYHMFTRGTPSMISVRHTTTQSTSAAVLAGMSSALSASDSPSFFSRSNPKPSQ
jgi:transposase